MATQKELGTKAFTSKDFHKAVEHFSQAILESPHDHTLYSNRSACYFNLNDFSKALEDGEKCISVKDDWDKGYQRKAMALQKLGRYDEAIENYEKGLQLNASNTQLVQGLEGCRQEKEAAANGGAGGDDPMGGMFGPQAMMKLMSNPRIAAYFQDPQFRNLFEMCKQKPEMLMQMMQMDPRFMDIFKELTGIDLMDVQENQMKNKEKTEEMRKKKEEEDKQRKEEEERKRKQEEEAALPEEEKQKIARKKEAEAKKNEGNEFYKKKQFQQALELYQAAIDIEPNDMTFYTNKAAAYYELKQYENCIAECDKAIQKSQEGYYDYVKLGKALARKATAFLAQQKYDEAIELYKNSLLENNDPNVKDQLKKAERIKREDEEKKMINPEIAEEHRKKGNELFEKGDFPGAVKEYTEGLKRDPQAKNIYSNRCAAYIKLLEFAWAMKDAEKCLQLDPMFVKGYVRKASCHHFMKEYHKALSTYDQGLKIDPDNKDLKEGKAKTLATIQTAAYSGDKPDEERVRHAMADPEIQMLLKDPRITQVLKDMQENPMAAQGALRDPFINEAINKLIAAGIIKMG